MANLKLMIRALYLTLLLVQSSKDDMRTSTPSDLELRILGSSQPFLR